MTINSLQVNTSTPVGGLGTQTFNVLVAGLYTCQVRFTIPYVTGSSDNSDTAADSPDASDLSIVVNLDTGGGPVAKLTLNNPTPTQPSMSGSVQMECDEGDVITVVLSSSAAADNRKNAVKGIINLFQGQGG